LENRKAVVQDFRGSAQATPWAKPILRPAEIRKGALYPSEPPSCRVGIAASIGPSEPGRDPAQPPRLKTDPSKAEEGRHGGRLGDSRNDTH